ncbi:receptor-type tyrosine-protein phosphatase epsilon-like [Mytilus californianus]|uniref:receptor-type tyrosine-protein phosphatase epsilon-like n=1 Tax=Mytilus californianus TaxID=6549 RepID=UPI002245188C|nr:receptor-type tyrosine-protein phosphatase epsilon-like [Mytilus californianus]
MKASIVTGIFITFGEHTPTEDNHTVYASNTSSSWETGTVLYDGKTLPTEINFFAVLRFLTYVPPTQDPFFVLEICEIGVIGCPPTHYGPVCTYSCPQNCQGPCNLESGNCTFGCSNGWTGNKCEQACDVGKYGKDCLEECSENCLNQQCNHVTGECSIGCTDGWQGFNCTQKCDNWYFGKNCSMECNCLVETCNKTDGICPIEGCKKGWHGESCDQRCNNGRFGRNCNRSCDGCLSNSCEATNGLCYNTTGCEPGYYVEEYCNNTCDDWYFGTNCTRNCNCLNEPCNMFTGKCPIGGCQKGWQGQSCEEGCNDGNFGRNCNRSCDGCISHSCEAINGLCYNTTGCEPGYLFDEYCNNTCDDWYFGNNCTWKCYCLTGPCSRFTGKCPSGGCQKGWHGESCEEAISELQKEDPPYAAAIGGSAAAVILILLIVVVFIIYRRRLISTKDRKLHRKSSRTETAFDTSKKNSSEHNYANINSIAKAEDVTTSLTENGETESQKVKNDDVNVYSNVLSVSKYKIMIGDLKAAVHEKQKGEDFKKEYEVLQKGLLYAHVEGSKEGNKVKNRFLSLWPYDHSRVVLKGDTTHDYINASYIDNYEKEKAYIAAQGPKNETLRDFWHMIWQEKVGKIVMVTQLKENHKIKCAKYWPKSVTKPLAVNNYIVTMKEEREHTVYVYRLLTVLNKNDTNVQERTIHHFHFTQWPDHGVPDSIKLVSFYRKVKIEKCYQNGPMVVHCSAGVGRTGTFIAIDALYEIGKNVGYVNVMECIEIMRKDRMNMVQTYEQYEAVFEALLELFTVPETSIPKNDFCKYISDQEHKTLPRNQNMYKLQFQRLEALRPLNPQSAYTAGTSKENIHKNSVKKIFPHNRYRPYTMSYARTRNDYINAVIIPGYTYDSKILVTQCPLAETVVDFWTMVYDHNSPIVVLLDKLNTNAPLWLGRQEILQFKRFTILQDNSPNPEEFKLTLNHKEKDPMTITVFTTSILNNDMNDAMLPSNILLDLLKKVKECWEKQKSPITVVCSDGCSKSGVLVALKLILEKMEIDDEIDVFQVVRTMQVRRPEFFTEFDQYEYCYRCIKEYLENDSVYANL